ncbi:MAG: hypothetical protein NZ480_09900 [Bdellovibrionaceae bacterium]|nr:hypothetical protein [Pseudobdellovibrionaceae bacterium]MDW8191008.1 hypothetical protein [Pseudobdellovibrionaceae bacterium]
MAGSGIYEASGFLVFDKKGDVFFIKNKNGQLKPIVLAQANQQVREILTQPRIAELVGWAKDTPLDQGYLWSYKTLEEVLAEKSGYTFVWAKDLNLLRKDDLKTPIRFTDTEKEKLRAFESQKIVHDSSIYPVGYFE